MFTLVEVQAHLAAWKAADLALAKGREYSMNGRSLTRADVVEVQSQISRYSRMESSLLARAAGRSGFNAKVPRW